MSPPAVRRQAASSSGWRAATIRRMPSRQSTVVVPTSSCIRVRSICTLSMVSAVGAKLGVEAGELGEVAAPLLDADRLVAAPVDGGGRGGGRGQQPGDHGDDVVLVDRVVDAGRVDVDGDLAAVEHHLEVDGRPPAPVAVGDRQPGDGGGQLEAVGRPPGGGLGGDLADAVGPEERPDAVVVAELVVLGEDVVAHRLVDAGGRAVEEGVGLPVVLHQAGQPAAVGPRSCSQSLDLATAKLTT